MTNVPTGLQAGIHTGAGSIMQESHHLAPVSTVEYRVVFALVFSVCLVLTALNRLLPRALRFLNGADADRGLLCEAKNTARSTVPYIFQV